jgi:hypothetical protein
MTGTLWHDEVDREGLLCALVLAPLTFPRNRFFSFFSQPWARRVRFRAAQIRSMLRHLTRAEEQGTHVHDLCPAVDGRVTLRYAVRGLGLERTATLERLELAVLRFALARAGVSLAEPAMTLIEEDRRLVEEALAQLGRKLELGSSPRELHAPETGES